MPYTELLKWITFFNENPEGYREDYRTYLMLKVQGIKESPEAIFPSIKAVRAASESKQIPDMAVPKGIFLDMLMNAKKEDGTTLTL